MKIDTREIDGVRIYDITGSITMRNSKVLRDTFRLSLDEGDRRFVFNLLGVPYMDSAALGETMACFMGARDRGGDVRLVVDPRSMIQDLLHLSTLDEILPNYTSEIDALGSFAAEV